MKYVIQTYGSSLLSKGLGGSFTPSSGTLEITGVETDVMILINIQINSGLTDVAPDLSSQEGLTLIDKRQIRQASEGVIFYSGVFMTTASTVKLVFSGSTSVSTYGFSACQLSIS